MLIEPTEIRYPSDGRSTASPRMTCSAYAVNAGLAYANRRAAGAPERPTPIIARTIAGATSQTIRIGRSRTSTKVSSPTTIRSAISSGRHGAQQQYARGKPSRAVAGSAHQDQRPRGANERPQERQWVGVEQARERDARDPQRRNGQADRGEDEERVEGVSLPRPPTNSLIGRHRFGALRERSCPRGRSRPRCGRRRAAPVSTPR
jgi:hypothetical protein